MDDLFYMHYEAYKKLKPRDKQIFDFLYLVLLIKPITTSNKDLVKDLNNLLDEKISLSILEKSLKSLAMSRLIIRNQEKKKDVYNGKWRTVSREIKLNPNLFLISPENVESISERVKQAILINETVINYNEKLKKYDDEYLDNLDRGIIKDIKEE